MRARLSPLPLLAALLATLFAGGRAAAASADGAIDTAHVSHVAWQDRRPLCPVDREAFSVLLYALADDLTEVRVRWWDDGAHVTAASRVARRGAYDAWQATIPSATGAQVRYAFELLDGAALAYATPSGVGVAPPPDSEWLVDFATLAHAPMGATLVTGGGAVFRVWAPGADSVAVRGEFNGWGVTPMTRIGDDHVARVANALPNQQYKYYFYPGFWSPDARGRVLDPASFLWNSRLADPTAFTWTDSAWQAPQLEQLVVYQLNVGTFSGLNDPNGPTPFPSRFVDLAARAHELAALGVNAVLLNPVTSTPSLQYAGYSTLNPWSPQFEYGMPDDFKAAVDALHANGIAVLCDIVWNHVDPATRFLWTYDGTQIYFESPEANTPWGPQPAFGRPEVDDYFLHSALHWLEEYHVDGFRMDAVAYMYQPPHETQGWALMQRFNDELERRWRGTVTIAENFPLQGSVVLPTSLGGAGFAATYNGEFHLNVRFAIPNNLGFSYPGYLVNNLLTPPPLTSARQSFNYLELHDNAWGPNGHRYLLDLAPTAGVVGDTAHARMRLALGALLLTPGVPAMLMGNEWLETADWGTAAANRIDWGKRAAHPGHYAFVRDLIDLRKRLPALHADAPCVTTHFNYSDGVFAWLRHDDLGRLYLVVANLGDSDFPTYLIGAPLAGQWTERLNSQAAPYGGTGLVNDVPLAAFARSQDGYPRTLNLKLPRSSVLVLQARNTLDVAGGAPAGPQRLERVWPNPARGPVSVEFVLPREGEADLSVFDAQGRRIAVLARGTLAAGPHASTWDGRDAGGAPAAPGLYLLCLRTADGVSTRRVALLR